MKKSKFLKKSLAMLLALMLVVAMIPLSAAAAANPIEMRQVNATAGGQTIQLTKGEETNTYVGAISDTSLSITLNVLVGAHNVVYYTDETTATSTEKMVTPRDGMATITIGAGTLSNYETEDDVYVIDFAVADEDAPATRMEYTVELNAVPVSTDITIKEFKIVNNEAGGPIPQLGETVIGVNDIYFTVAYNQANLAQDPTFTVESLELAEGAKMVVAETKGSATKGDVITDGYANIVDGLKVTVSNANGSTNKEYTIHVSVADGFKSFTTKEGLDEVIFTKDGDIVVLLPYGYSADKDKKITVTPIFELDYPNATASVVNGGPLDGVDDTITVDANKVTDGAWDARNDNQSDITFDDFAEWTKTKASADDLSDMTAVATGINHDDNSQPVDEATQIKIKYTEQTSRVYDVYFVEPFENPEAAITELTIGSETATIDQDAKTIDITVPMGTDLSSLNTHNSHDKVDMVASNGATIDIPFQKVEFTEIDNTRNRYVDFDVTPATDSINATQSVQIRVVSQDKSTENFYTLNVTESDEYVKPALLDMTLEAPDGTQIEGDIDTVEGQNVVKFELPYEIFDKGELANWKLFYTKTVGASITYDKDHTNGQNNIALPKTGAAVDTTAPYWPEVGSKDYVTAIDLHIDGSDKSGSSTSYYVVLTRAKAQTISTMESFSLYGVPNFAAADEALDDYHLTANLSTRFQYKSETIGSGDKITVNVPYSVYRQWDENEFFNAIAEVTKNAEGKDANAKVFLLSGNTDWYVELSSYAPTNTKSTQVVKNGRANGNVDGENGYEEWRLYNGATIYVLSEEAWVNLKADSTSGYQTAPSTHAKAGLDFITSASFESKLKKSGGSYTKYTLKIDQADAKKGNELKDVRLVDGTGWSAPVTITGGVGTGVGTLSGKIPYALTSDIHDPRTWNPVYLEYSSSERAFVMGVDESRENSAPNKPNGIPASGTLQNTAGRNYYDGVFIDIADYLAMYEVDGEQNYDLALEHYYDDGNPYLIIDRDGTVYICNDAVKSTTAQFEQIKNDVLVDNMLMIANESGINYQKYTWKLDVNPANQGTEFSSFYFEEYPNRRGIIDNEKHTITVTLPYGSEYTYLTPNYTVSEGAVVTIDDPELMGKPVFPGYTDVNFSADRKITVIAENENDTAEYTVRVLVDERFSDVAPGAWYYDNVMDAAANEYVSGYEDGTFKPGNSVTRAEFASMIAKAMGYDDSLAGETRFKDVAADKWYAGAITFCADNGIISGYDDGTFQPGKTISRQEVASILKNAFNLTGNTGDLFPDDSAIAGWAKENVYAVKHSGLMKGYEEDGTFRPNGLMTRAEAASILMNANRAGLIK